MPLSAPNQEKLREFFNEFPLIVASYDCLSSDIVEQGNETNVRWRVYTNGYCEQEFYNLTIPTSYTNKTKVTFKKTLMDTNYSITLTGWFNDGGATWTNQDNSFYEFTESSFIFEILNLYINASGGSTINKVTAKVTGYLY